MCAQVAPCRRCSPLRELRLLERPVRAANSRGPARCSLPTRTTAAITGSPHPRTVCLQAQPHVELFTAPSFAAVRAAISAYCSMPASSFLSCPLTKRKTVPGATPVSPSSESLLSAASSSSPRTPGASLCGDAPSTTVLILRQNCARARHYANRHSPHKEPVVGNHQQRAVVLPQGEHQAHDGVRVQVRGNFVQNKQLRWRPQQLGERNSDLLTATQKHERHIRHRLPM
jgi:hypothetical protein